MIYYGCRECHQSKSYYLADRVIAVLNSGMETDAVERSNTLHVNWLKHRELFDFDGVEIIQATDEAIERFAVQVGNDTNPNRRPRYKQMQCTVSKNCALSQNTARILQHTFDSVEFLAIVGGHFCGERK